MVAIGITGALLVIILGFFSDVSLVVDAASPKIAAAVLRRRHSRQFLLVLRLKLLEVSPRGLAVSGIPYPLRVVNELTS